MFSIHRSIDIDFSHHIRGHGGACINLHGHTWKLEVGLEADTLDAQGFVVDFGALSSDVLKPCHALLDHSLALGEATYGEVEGELERLGAHLLGSRRELHGRTDTSKPEAVRLHGAETRYPGGLKVAVFPFNPTSERLAEWLFTLSASRLEDDRVRVAFARVYETLHPVESVAEHRRG